MKENKSGKAFRPFEGLNQLLLRKKIVLPQKMDEKSLPQKRYISNHVTDRTGKQPIDEKDDCRLFMEAMADVTPIDNIKRSGGREFAHPDRLTTVVSLGVDDTVEKLQDLINHGKGFIISHTPEYTQGVGYNVPVEIARRLHHGQYAIEGHIDLHGYTVISAKEAFFEFMHKSILKKKKTLLVIHGRGLSSPCYPVLKTKVIKWLTTGPLRKWIMAFTSARACDGGTGATYVRLRTYPLSKKYRKKEKWFTQH